MASLFGGIGLLVVPETSAARILQLRAKNLRHETKNWALHSKADENQITMHTILTVYLVRPFVMIVQEPILALLTAYMSYLYGVIYLLFEAVRLPSDTTPGFGVILIDHSFPSPSAKSEAGASASALCPSSASS